MQSVSFDFKNQTNLQITASRLRKLLLTKYEILRDYQIFQSNRFENEKIRPSELLSPPGSRKYLDQI